MKLPYVTVDVFTAVRFGGNPLAVVLDGSGLSTDQMQQIAAEFNYSETTFILPPEDASNTARVRIFTPRAELPFAGHPNVGTAYVLARDGDVFGKPTGDTLRFEEIAGLVEVEILKEGAGIVGARLTSPEPFKRGDDVASARVAEACGIDATDLAIVNHSPCVATAGLPFVFAEVNSAGALSVASPVTDAFARHFPAADVAGICLYACVPKDQADVQARVFAPLHGVPEDPATGSANVALVGLRASVAAGDDLEFDHVVAQGADMGRPSLLYAGAEKANGVVTATRVGGRCVPVMKGALSLS